MVKKLGNYYKFNYWSIKELLSGAIDLNENFYSIGMSFGEFIGHLLNSDRIQ